MTHKPIIKESAASTRIRMVFDSSCKPTVADYAVNESRPTYTAVFVEHTY